MTLFKTIEIRGKRVTFSELCVRDVLVLLTLDLSEEATLLAFVEQVFGITDIADWDEPDVHRLMGAFSELHPTLLDEQNNQTPQKEPDVAKQAIIEQVKVSNFNKNILSLIEIGHPNLLDYPYSLYVTLVDLHKK